MASVTGRAAVRRSLNLTAVMGCPWRQAVQRAQLSFSSFCFFFWKGEKKKHKAGIRHEASATTARTSAAIGKAVGAFSWKRSAGSDVGVRSRPLAPGAAMTHGELSLAFFT